MKRHNSLCLVVAALAAFSSTIVAYRSSFAETPSPASTHAATAAVAHKTVTVDGMEIFYREAGPQDAPSVLLLHGFPTSSQMYRNLIPALADKYHVVAPDYPGYGHSEMPSRDKFTYTFDNLAKVVDRFTEQIGLKSFALYVQDYGDYGWLPNRSGSS